MKEKETAPYESLIFASNAIHRAATKKADEAFKSFGMGYSHAWILIQVLDTPGISIGKISETLMLTASTVTRLCEKLEKTGHLKRSVSGRNTLLQLGGKGQKIAPELKKSWAALHSDYADLLGEEQLVKLINRLNKSAKKLNQK